MASFVCVNLRKSSQKEVSNSIVQCSLRCLVRSAQYIYIYTHSMCSARSHQVKKVSERLNKRNSFAHITIMKYLFIIPFYIQFLFSSRNQHCWAGWLALRHLSMQWNIIHFSEPRNRSKSCDKQRRVFKMKIHSMWNCAHNSFMDTTHSNWLWNLNCIWLAWKWRVFFTKLSTWSKMKSACQGIRNRQMMSLCAIITSSKLNRVSIVVKR